MELIGLKVILVVVPENMVNFPNFSACLMRFQKCVGIQGNELASID